MAVSKTTQVTQRKRGTPSGTNSPPLLGLTGPFAPGEVENQLPTRTGDLIRYRSSQHFKMAACWTARQCRPIQLEKKAPRTGGRVSNSGGTRREAGGPTADDYSRNSGLTDRRGSAIHLHADRDPRRPPTVSACFLACSFLGIPLDPP
jgi:hypothetical protein